MARYLLQSGVDQLKGSRGGSTFQKSGKVFSIRKRSVPVQKRSISQSQVKNHLDFVQKRWKNLSPTDQLTFGDEAPNYQRINSLGNVYQLAPHMLQSSANLRLVASNSPIIDQIQSPIVPLPISVDLFEMGTILNEFYIVLFPNIVQAGCEAFIYARAINQTQQAFAKNDLFLLGSVDEGNDMNAYNWYTPYAERIGNFVEINGWFIPITVDIVQKDSGQIITSISNWAILSP